MMAPTGNHFRGMAPDLHVPHHRRHAKPEEGNRC
jgi:hypothetical protein